MKTSIAATPQVNTLHDDSTATMPIVHDHHDSPLSNVKYGAGMLAFIVIPPLVPGTTPRIIIIGVMCLIISIYTAAGLMAAIRKRQPVRRRRMT